MAGGGVTIGRWLLEAGWTTLPGTGSSKGPCWRSGGGAAAATASIGLARDRPGSQVRSQRTPHGIQADTTLVPAQPGVDRMEADGVVRDANLGDAEDVAESEEAVGGYEEKSDPMSSSPAVGYFKDAPPHELLGLFRSLTSEDRFDAALEVVRKLVQAERLDVLRRLRHKEFLRRAADRGAVKQAFRFVQLLPRKFADSRTYNMLVTVCVRAKNAMAALKAADMMKTTGLKLDVHLYTNLITACSGVGDVETAFKLFQELQESGQTADRQVYGALISTLGQAMKVGNTERRAQLVLLERACHLLEDMKESNILPDTANWNTLLTCAARSGQLQHAFEILQKMERNGCRPDAFTYSTLIDACGKAGEKELGLKIYKRALKEIQREVAPSVVLFTSAIEVCASGLKVDLDAALSVYNDLGRHGIIPDTQLYAALIKAAGRAGDLDFAFALREEMDAEEVQPGVATCSALIAAALSNNRIELAGRVYTEHAARGVYPSLEHFNSIIMAYARLARLGDVVKLIEDFVSLDLKPDIYTYTAIMSACQRADQAELAFAVSKLMKKQGISWDEGICFALLRVFYNRLRASWYNRKGTPHKLKHRQPFSIRRSEAEGILRALGGKDTELLEGRASSDADWVNRAVMVYRTAVSDNLTPTLKVLDRLFACLRIPYTCNNRKSRLQTLHPPLGVDICVPQEVQQLANSQSYTDSMETAFFDPRAVQLVKEAMCMGVLPQFHLGQKCMVDMQNLAPTVAEVYVLTLCVSLKKAYSPWQPYADSISFIVPPFNPEDVFTPSIITTNTKIPPEDNEPELDKRSADSPGNEQTSQGSATCATSLGVVAMLQRLKIWYKTDATKGKIWIEPEDVNRWIQASHRHNMTTASPGFAKPNEGVNLKTSIVDQQRRIRLGIDQVKERDTSNEANGLE